MKIPEHTERELGGNAAGEAVLVALRRMYEADAYLLKVDANERTITARLASYLQGELLDWDVDCEYNRDGVDPKRIKHIEIYPNQEDTHAQTVFPDIIAHRRGTSQNYMALEVKKSSNTASRDNDHDKLRGYKADLNYEYALFLDIGVGNDTGQLSVQWIDVQQAN